MSINYSSYHNPDSIYGAGVGNGGNLHPNVFMTTKVGGSTRKMKRIVKGGRCPCMSNSVGITKGGLVKTRGISKKRYTRARKTRK